MKFKNIFKKLRGGQDSDQYHYLDNCYLPLDKQAIYRTRNIRLIPGSRNRRGGKLSYAEWAYCVGIFQTLMNLHLQQKESNNILDIGCGTGLLGIASEPFLAGNGKYTGIDVMKRDIDFCRSHYPFPDFNFIHFDVANAAYAPGQKENKIKWPVENDCYDLVTALSVWTHLNQEDALFYFSEISRVLKPARKAIITFFLLDDVYRDSIEARTDQQGEFHMLSQKRWIFDQPSYGSDMWFHPKWANIPEEAIGVNETGLEKLIKCAGMKLVEHYQGNWKEVPGVFFQDILVFEKPEGAAPGEKAP